MIAYTVKVYPDGTKEWYLNDQLHREDGAAIEYPEGGKSWYLDGESLTEQDHAARLNPTKELTVAQIEKLLGHNIKIIKE